MKSWIDIIFNKSLTIQNSRSLLEPINISHLNGLCKVGLEKSLWDYNPVYCCTERQHMQTFIEKAVQSMQINERMALAIFDKQTGEYAGSSSFYEVSEIDRRISIGHTWYGKKYQRTGLNANVKYLMLDFAFTQLGARRVQFYIDGINNSSRASIQSYGARLDGILRQHMLVRHQNRVRDSCVYSILNNEWPDVKEKFFKKKVEIN